MAKADRSRYRTKATEPTETERPADVASLQAERDLLAAVLEAAGDSDLEKCLRQIVAYLGKYSKCSCIGVLLFEHDTVAGCTSCHGTTPEFRRVPRDSFPTSATCICNAVVGIGADSHPPFLADRGTFFRNSRPDASASKGTTNKPAGICIGSTFESVALIPIRHFETVVGFVFIGDESKDSIPPKTLKFLERLGSYVGNTMRLLEPKDRVRPSKPGLPGKSTPMATASTTPDEMELVTRLIDNANESIVITQDWRILYVNNKCAEMAGVSKQDMIGLAFLEITHPDDREAVKERYSRILNGEWFSSGTVFRGVVGDGSTRWAELREIPFSWNGRPAVMSLVNDITDRKRAEEALAQSEKKYRFLAENTTDVIWVTDLNLKPTYFSPSVMELLGYTVEEAMAGTLEQRATPASAEMAARALAQAAAREQQEPGSTRSQTFELEIIRKDGSTVWAETTVTFMRDSNGQPAGILGAMRDVTERRRAREALRVSEERYRLLVETANEAIAVIQDGVLKFVSPKIENISGYKASDVSLKSFVDFIHPDDLQMVAEHYARRLKGEEASPTYQFRFIDKAGNTKWAEVNAVLFDWEGRTATLALISDITDWKKANEALKASEERFRTLIEESTDAIAILDAGGSLLYESPSMERVTGYKLEDWLGTPVGVWLLHPDDMAAMASLLERLMAHPELASEEVRVRFKHKDGTWHVLEGTVRNLLGDPKVNGLVINYRDVTERVKADQALRDSEERFRTIIENAQDAITVIDGDFHITYESPSLARVTGYPPEEWVGKGLTDMEVHPDDVTLLASKFELLKSQPGMVIEDFCIRYRHRDGSWHIIEASGRNLLHDTRVKGIVVNFRDITARRRMEEALRESELRYRLLAENASDVIFTADLAMRLTYVSPSVVQLTGYTPEETLSRNIDGWVAPGSREFVLKSFPRALSRAKSRTELSAAARTASVEMLKKDGGTIWAEIKMDFLRDAGGQPIGMLGVARDITDRRMAEIELEHRVQLETLITEISTAFIGISTEYMDQGIRNALEAISGFTEVDWSCIFTFRADGTALDLAYEWRSRNSEPSTGRLKSVRADSIPWLVARIRQVECVQIPELADLPAEAEGERALLRKQGMRSIVLVPMLQGTTAVGFLGLGSAHGKKDWNEETIMLLRLVAEMFSNALERKRMDSALRESEKRYRLVAENITDVIWTTDLQTNITYMSPSATALVGYAAEELGKLTVEDLLTADSLERGMKALADQQNAVGVPPERQSDHWTLEVEMRRKDGSTVWAEEKVTFLRDERGTPVGLLGVTRDISQRKAAEDALRVSEEKYRTLVEVSPDGVLSIDRLGIITDCNTGLCRMLGYNKEQLRGREARLLGTRKDLDAEPDYRAHLVQGEFMELETEILRHNGQALPVWAKLVRVAEPNTADIQTIIYFRDIADRRKIDEMKDEFIGLVSHELRSPLTVIIGSLHTAISEGPRLSQKETRQLLLDAALEAEQLSHLVGNLLELSRAQANRLFLHVEPLNLAKAVQKVIGSIERQSPKHKFIVDLPRKLPPVSADQLRLERILYNLLENGARYSPEGSEITVSATREEGQLVVSVSDQGPGISKEDQDRLFKPFQQLSNQLLDHTKGAGLGLLVCRRLVEAHGGRIWIESEPGHGATFRFTLEASAKDGLEAG
jgi:PAS domain S-box-containing protein